MNVVLTVAALEKAQPSVGATRPEEGVVLVQFGKRPRFGHPRILPDPNSVDTVISYISIEKSVASGLPARLQALEAPDLEMTFEGREDVRQQDAGWRRNDFRNRGGIGKASPVFSRGRQKSALSRLGPSNNGRPTTSAAVQDMRLGSRAPAVDK